MKTSTYVNVLPRENVEHQHCGARFWLPNIAVQRDDTRLRVRSCIEARMGDKG